MVLFVVLAMATTPAVGAVEWQVLVSDWGGSKIVRFDYPSGLPVDHFVAYNISPLNDARGLTLAPDGSLYVSSHDNNSILRYDAATGQLLNVVVVPSGGGLYGPQQLLFGPDERLYVASYYDDEVLRYNADGTDPIQFVRPREGGLDGPIGLIFDDDGDLLVSSYFTHEVLKYDGSTGNFIEVVVPAGAAGLNAPWDMVYDNAGDLLIAGWRCDCVVAVDRETGDVRQFIRPGLGGLNGPVGLAMTPDGSLLVTMIEGDGAVLEYDGETGQFLGVFLSPRAGGLSGDPSYMLFLPVYPKADLDRDGDVDLEDYAEFGTLFGGPHQ